MGEIFVHEGPRPEMGNTGERLTVGHLLETDLEHFHRYYLARHFARGKDVVDVACGEGYGAAMLAQVARSVQGVDLAADAVAHANLAYPAANLRFLQGDATRIPVADASVDVVSSFETIEHFYDHDAFFREVRRILRPGGLLVLSTPNRDLYSPAGGGANPYHVREMTREEFYRKCAACFATVAAFSQTTMVGSVVLADDIAPAAAPLIFERRGEGHVELSEGVLRGKFCLCLASDAALPALSGSLLIHSANIDGGGDGGVMNRPLLAHLQAEVEQRYRENRRLIALGAKRDQALAELHERQMQLAQTRHDRDARRLNAALEGRDRVLAEREQALARARAEMEGLGRALAEAEAGRKQLAGARVPPRRVLSRLRRLLRGGLGGGTERTIRDSALFDAGWYALTYPDIGDAGIDAAAHYLRHGLAEGRDPGPRFSTVLYLQEYPDVRGAGVNPLLHYERTGRAEGRRIFDSVAVGSPRVPRRRAPATPKLIVCISGEYGTPGHVYRVARPVEAMRQLGAEVITLSGEQIGAHLDDIGECDLLVIWRARWGEGIEAAVAAARAAGARVQFDVDDLMFEPELATAEVIDGIRTLGYDAAETGRFFANVARVAEAADYCTAPTAFLAGRLRRFGRPAWVVANGFDEQVWQQARLAVRARERATPDGLVRIGYAAGTRTHQKDFAAAAQAVGDCLREHRQARLVLFRKGPYACLDPQEFPALEGLEGQIEWREMVPVEMLPAEMAAFDITIAPLEAGNPFCEAKSELKFFESALVEVPLVATPTQVFRDAVIDGRTGFLAGSEADWRRILGLLVTDAPLRRRIGRAAYFATLWPYGPQARVDRLRSVLAREIGAAAEAARAVELELRRGAAAPARLVELPPYGVEVLQEGSGLAAVAIAVQLRDGRDVLTTLEAAHGQTLGTLDLVVVDDGSAGAACAGARGWLRRNLVRFNRVVLLHADTQDAGAPIGAAEARDIGFAGADTGFVIPLEAGAGLPPAFAERCLEAARDTACAFACADGRATDGVADGAGPGAPALVRLSAWAGVGGYAGCSGDSPDRDLRRRFAERGMYGEYLPEALAE